MHAGTRRTSREKAFVSAAAGAAVADIGKGKALAYVLSLLARAIEGGEFEKRIVEPGPAMGAKVFAAYRVASLIGKPGSGGHFKLRAQGDLFKTLCRVLRLLAGDGRGRSDPRG